jgi:hypothetical protein
MWNVVQHLLDDLELALSFVRASQERRRLRRSRLVPIISVTPFSVGFRTPHSPNPSSPPKLGACCGKDRPDKEERGGASAANGNLRRLNFEYKARQCFGTLVVGEWGPAFCGMYFGLGRVTYFFSWVCCKPNVLRVSHFGRNVWARELFGQTSVSLFVYLHVYPPFRSNISVRIAILESHKTKSNS